MDETKTLSEVCSVLEVSRRAVQGYENAGLVSATGKNKYGHLLYDEEAQRRIKQIRLLQQLGFRVKEIKEIIDAPNFDREKALEQQIELLTLKKEHLENLIDFAREIKTIGVNKMDFTVFDTKKIDEYSKRAKEQWGDTPEYHEYEEKAKNMTEVQQKDVINSFMLIFAEFGKLKDQEAASDIVQMQVKKLQDFIPEHYYKCSKEILSGLGKMYACGGEFTENINRYGGEGTAEFTAKAIDIYCSK